MKKLAALCVALLLALLFSRSPTSIAMAAYLTPGPAAFSGHAADLLVKIKDKNKKKKNKNQNNDNNGGNGGAETQGTGGAPADGGDHVCPAGYVTLDKKNKYGAFCEPREGVCAKGLIGTPPNCKCPEGTLSIGTADQPCVAKMNCQFPGQVGNPPNCECPKGTEFVGYKGCVKVTVKETCENVDAIKIDAYITNCQKLGGKGEAAPITRVFQPGEKQYTTECCTIKYYEK